MGGGNENRSLAGFQGGFWRAAATKAVRTLLGTMQDRAVFALLIKEYTALMSDGAKHANKRSEGVVPSGLK